MQRFSVEPRGPFRLAAAREYFGGWADLADDGEAIVMAFPIETEGWRNSAAVVVRQDSGSGRVEAEVVAPDEDAEYAWQQAQAALSLDADGAGFPDVGRRDAVIGGLQAQYEGLRPVCFYSPYEAAASFVMGHRLSIAQTRALRSRLAREHGDAIVIGERTVHALPRPHVLLELDSFGPVAGEKMERVHGVAQAALEGRLDRARLRAMPIEEALADLRSLRGVGPFIASAIVLRGAGLADEVSADEVTQQAVQRAYGLATVPDRQTLEDIADQWRPYRTWCCVLLHLWLRSGETGSFTPAGRSRRRH